MYERGVFHAMEDVSVEVLDLAVYDAAFRDSVETGYLEVQDNLFERLYDEDMMRETLRWVTTFSVARALNHVRHVLSVPENYNDYLDKSQQANRIAENYDTGTLPRLLRFMDRQLMEIAWRKVVLVDREGNFFFSNNFHRMWQFVFFYIEEEEGERDRKIEIWQEIMVVKYYVGKTSVFIQDMVQMIDEMYVLVNQYRDRWIRDIDGRDVFVSPDDFPHAPPAAAMYKEKSRTGEKPVTLFF